MENKNPDLDVTGKHSGSLHGSGTHDQNSKVTAGGYADRVEPEHVAHDVGEEAGAGAKELEALIEAKDDQDAKQKR
jgi:hypothetical protein